MMECIEFTKPLGYNTVSPYLVVDGASQTIDFLIRVFGAVELRRFPDSTGKIMHAEVRIDDTVVMLADGARVGRRFRPTCTSMFRRSTPCTGAPLRQAQHRCRNR